MLDAEMRDRLRAAAMDLLAAELPRLVAANVMPVPGRDSPWIDQMRLGALRYGTESELAKALVEAVPDRWTGPRTYPRAEEYVTAFLRAAAAAATLEAIVPNRTPSRAALVEELLDHLENPDQVTRLLRLATDIDVAEVEGRSVHGTRIRAVHGLGETLQFEILEATSAVHSLRAVPLGSREPRALLIAQQAGHDPWKVAFDLRPHLIHVATALRLVTAASIIEPLEVYGQPGMVHIGGPYAVLVDPDHASSWRRVSVVRPEQLTGVEALAAQICELDKRPPQAIPPSIVVAITRFNRSHRAAAWADIVIDIAIGLEAALSTGEKGEITLRIRTRAAHLLARQSDTPTELFRDVGELLEIRGKVAHGDSVPPKRWADLFKARGLEQVMVEDRMSVLFDRWRDILRRAILARLLLESGSGSWTLRRPPNGGVDAALVGPQERRVWRRLIRQRAVALGIAAAIDRPPPLRDFLHDPYSDSLDH